MNLEQWRNLADIARTAWLRASVWCAMLLSTASTRGVTVAVWTVAATFLLDRLSAHR